jgi:hypothetical protein
MVPLAAGEKATLGQTSVRSIVIAVVATAALLGALLLVLWIDASSTGTVPL